MGWKIEELSKEHNVYVLYFGRIDQNDDRLRNGLNASIIECKKLSNSERILSVINHPLTASMFAKRKSRLFEKRIKDY